MSEPIAGLAVSLDRGSPVPLYFQVATQLEKMIESGEMPVGGRLANEVELADRLGVSRPTMRRAIQYLVERGMLVRKRGVGTQIVHPKVRRPVELSSLYDDLVKTGQSPVTEVLDFGVGPRHGADGRAVRRAGGPGGHLVRAAAPRGRRAAGADAQRRAHDGAVAGPGRPGAREASTSCCALRATCRAWRRRSSAPARRTRPRPGCCSESRGAPLLTMSRTAWDEKGEAVEYGAHVYRASRYSFELSLTV